MNLGKIVVITGVSSGFEVAAAAHLLRRGYGVYGSVRTTGDEWKVSENLKSTRFRPLECDVTNHVAIAAAITLVSEELKGEGIAGLVNNAGIAPRGRIIKLSSTSGGITFPMLGAYSASGYAPESLNDGLRRELRRYGIKVIAIEPGSIRTSIWDKSVRDGHAERYAGTAFEKLTAQMPAFFERQLQRSRSIDTVTRAISCALEAHSPRLRYPLDGLGCAGKYLSNRLLDRLTGWQLPKG